MDSTELRYTNILNYFFHRIFTLSRNNTAYFVFPIFNFEYNKMMKIFFYVIWALNFIYRSNIDFLNYISVSRFLSLCVSERKKNWKRKYLVSSASEYFIPEAVHIISYVQIKILLIFLFKIYKLIEIRFRI